PGSGYSVDETPTVGWDLTGATCDNGNTPDDISIDPGQTVTCSFTNTERGNIVVVKQTVGSTSTQSFDFTATGGPSELNDSFSLANGQSHSEDNVLPGSGYAVAEGAVPAGWVQTGASCDNEDSPDAVSVDPGQTVTCTFVNTATGPLKLEKTVAPST